MIEFPRSARILALGSILSLAMMASPLLLASEAKATTSICDAIASNIVTNCGFEGGVYSSTIGAIQIAASLTDGHQIKPLINIQVTTKP
jgi:L-asparaginase II